MNRQFFTLMTVFLMLGTLWGKAWAQQSISHSECTNGEVLSGSKYYLLGKDNKFLQADIKTFNDKTYTILSEDLLEINSSTKIEDLDKALWAIEAIEIGGSFQGYQFKNKATGATTEESGLLYLRDLADLNYAVVPEKSLFIWFPTKNYDNAGAPIKIGNNGTYYLQLTSNKVTTSTTSSPIHAYTITTATLNATQMNKQMGDGFQLMAKANNGKVDVAANGLLDIKLTAAAFYTVSDISAATGITDVQKTQIAKITSNKTAISANDYSYFITSGYDELAKYVSTGDLQNNNFYIKITKDNYKEVLAVFKKANFTTIISDKVQDLQDDSAESGKYNKYATKSGEDLLSSNNHIENAQFYISYDPSRSSVEYPYNWLIIEAKAKFGTTNTEITVRPYLRGINGINQVYTWPTSTSSGWTQITFTTGTGLVTSSAFGKDSYSITVYDKKQENKFVTEYTLHPNGQSFSYTENSTTQSAVSFEKTSNILQDKPEGLWKILYNTEKQFILYNRETGATVNLGTSLYKVNGATDLYFVQNKIKGFRSHDSGILDDNIYIVDTIRITKNNGISGLNGYANSGTDARFDRVNLQSTAYMLGIENAGFDTTVYIMNSKQHDNALMVNVKKNEGLYFYLVPTDTISYGLTSSGSNVANGGYYDADKKDPIDNLRRVQYVLQEMTTKRYVIYDNVTGDNTFKLDDHEYCNSCSVTDRDNLARGYAARFYLKEKENKQYTLVHSVWSGAGTIADPKVNTANKKVGANIYTGLLYRANLYNSDNADKFGLYIESEVKYEDILKKFLGRNDTSLVKINLLSVQNAWGNSWSDKNCYMLLPGYHNFLMEGYPRPEIELKTRATLRDSLAMGGQLHDSIKFSIVVDTAYVRRAGVSMPMYYLGMSSSDPNENIQKGELVGPLHPWHEDGYGHRIECTHYALSETSKGNFLFAMQDSIDHATGKDIVQEDYCYHYWLTHNPRLRFVHARHRVDTMIISSYNKMMTPNYIKAGNTSATTEVGYKQRDWLAPQLEGYLGKDGHPNYGLFAFETNPKPSNMYGRPEYALYNVASRKYVTYTNGNVILSDQPSWYIIDISNKDNDHFIVGNEEALTSDVRILAGTGKVTIQKAAGKQIVITNALGKPLVNTILTSDNAEIAVPQGIIFINIEGEKTAAKAMIK